MALALGVQHWRPYLLGRHFLVYTDQKSLRHLLQQPLTTIDQQSWIAKLLGYSFDIIYKLGFEDKVAVALSKNPDQGELNELISFPLWLDRLELTHEQNPSPQPGFVYKHDVLFYQDRLVVSASSPRIRQLIEEFHSTSQGGHSSSGGSLNGFVTGLPKSSVSDAVLLIVDWLSKYAHFLPLKHQYTAELLNYLLRKLFVCMSSSYHPEIDGQTEVINHCLETYLRCFIPEQPRHWLDWLSWAELWYNTTFHNSTNSTPFEVVYDHSMLPTRRDKGEAVARELVDRDVGDYSVEPILPEGLEVELTDVAEPEDILASGETVAQWL
ncbi:Tf2-6, partial [Mucuna pruriens]